jgi:hypothetical protein
MICHLLSSIMSHRWGRLSCACRHCRRHNPRSPSPSLRPLRDSAIPLLRCFRSPSPSLPLPRVLASSATRLRDSTPPLLRRSNRHHNKNKIIKHCVSIALLFVIHTSSIPSNLERRSSGGTESQSRAAGGAMERGSGLLFVNHTPPSHLQS